MALWLPRWLRDEEPLIEDPTRRTFLFLGAAAAIVPFLPQIEIIQPVALIDPPLAYPVSGFTLAEADRILKELYLPAIRAQVANSNTLAKLYQKELNFAQSQQKEAQCRSLPLAIKPNRGRRGRRTS